MSSKVDRMFQRIFRSKSLNFPKIKSAKKDKDKKHTSLLSTLPKAQYIWEYTSQPVNKDPDDDVGLRSPCDVVFLAPHVFVVADSEAHKLDVFDLSREGDQKHCGTIGTGTVWPNAIAKYYNDEGKILLTDRRERMIKLYDVERGQLLSAFGSPWNDEEIPYWPHGITMTSKKEIIITETSSHAIHVYTKNGKLQHTFGKHGNLLEELRLPFYCSVDNRDRIIVSDNLNYSVKVFTSKGRQVAFMGAGNHDNPSKKLACPFGVCSNLEGEVIVCDYERNRIVEYDLANIEHEKDISSRAGGDSLFSITRKSADLTIPEFTRELANSTTGCRSPCGVAVGPCGTMVYTEYGRKHAGIKAYSLFALGTVV